MADTGGEEQARRRAFRTPLMGIWAGILGWIGQRALARSPGWAEAVAGSAPILEGRRIVSLVTAWVPFSLLEVFVLLALAGMGLWVWRALRARDFALAAVRLAGGVGAFVFLFQLFWGIQYTRPGIEELLGVEAAGEVSAEELAWLAQGAIALTNRHYLEVHGVDDMGIPTRPSPHLDAVASLEPAWRWAAAHWELPERMTRPHGDPKPLLASAIFRRFGVAGIHFPFTGEALVLRGLPTVSVGTTLAHEMAHQRGVASESDANVLAVLVARESGDARTRYAAYSFLQRQWLAALARVNRDWAVELVGERLPGVQRDMDALAEFWRPAEGVAGAMGNRLNDAMLRSQGVREGVLSYRGSTWVFVALVRREGAQALLPGWAPVDPPFVLP